MFYIKHLNLSHIDNLNAIVVNLSEPCKIERRRVKKRCGCNYLSLLISRSIVFINLNKLSHRLTAAILMTLRKPKCYYVLFFVSLSGKMVSMLLILYSNFMLVSIALYYYLLSQVLLSNFSDENGA